ncbi:Smr/MutS family protein [Candidatus Pelagibacter sp. HIMB1521]|uniref:Smr/MutS family protein n=1 Tax=Candidatus Pelagibacter sp. HIMB1521 TaxID=3413344 RepID=UPI003F8718B2
MKNQNSDKDIKDWEKFINSNDKLPNKDEIKKKKIINQSISIDLHGYKLDEANKVIEKLVLKAYEEKILKIIVITGKGLHSNVEKNPYVSKNLSILKYSVPEYLNNNKALMNIIYDITDAKIEDGGSGAFYIYLKKNLKK